MEKYARMSPYDINSDEVHRLISHLSNNDDESSVNVVFKTWNERVSGRMDGLLGRTRCRRSDNPPSASYALLQPTKIWIGIDPLMRS